MEISNGYTHKNAINKIIIPYLIFCLAVISSCQQLTHPTLSVKKTTNNKPKSQKIKSIKFYSDIDWVSLFVKTPLIDIENDGIADGVGVRLYFYKRNFPKPVAGKGTVVFHLFQKIKSPTGRVESKELYQWIITPDELTKYINVERFGLICHQITLYWSNLQITKPDVYLQAEFVRDDQKKILSLPVYLVITITK